MKTIPFRRNTRLTFLHCTLLHGIALCACGTNSRASEPHIEVVQGESKDALAAGSAPAARGTGTQGAAVEEPARETDMLAKIHDIVDTIVSMPEVTRPSLERALDIKLVHQADVAADLEYYQASFPGGPFATIELRLPNAQQAPFLLVQLVVRDDIQLPVAEFREKLLNPNAPAPFRAGMPMAPEGINTYTLTEGQSYVVSYGFGAQTKALRQISIGK